MVIHERIKERRKELELSADDLANSLGISRATLYRYESADIEKLPLSILEPLSKALMCSPAYLMGWVDSPSAVMALSFNSLTAEETDLVNMYRNLDIRGQNNVRRTAEYEYSQRKSDTSTQETA